MDEKWVSIPGYENLYRISSIGRIRSLPRNTIAKNGKQMSFPARILKQSLDDDGYLNISLTDEHGQSKQYRVSRLVAMTFIPNPNNLPIVNHLDGNKQNNNVDNLEWCTVKQNNYHAYETGLNKTHVPVPVTCLDNMMKFESYSEAARYVGCDIGNIIQSINMQSCCKNRLCFCKTSEIPEDIEKYLFVARTKYDNNKCAYRSEIKCLDSGQVYKSIAECARQIEGKAGYIQECISNRRLYKGKCYVRTKDVIKYQWDETEYCRWVHERKLANSRRDYRYLERLDEYGKQRKFM